MAVHLIRVLGERENSLAGFDPARRSAGWCCVPELVFHDMEVARIARIFFVGHEHHARP